MSSAEVLIDAYGRIRDTVHRTVDGLSPEHLTVQLEPGTNSIAWLLWHLSRVQDDHLSDVAGLDEVWTSEGWFDRFGLPFDRAATGYGHGPEDVAAVVASADLLVGYHDAVHQRSERFLRDLADPDLERIVDTSWNPPVTLGVRLVSVISDNMQHAGQAAFVRGVIERR